jgi:hypothetical protein
MASATVPPDASADKNSSRKPAAVSTPLRYDNGGISDFGMVIDVFIVSQSSTLQVFSPVIH